MTLAERGDAQAIVAVTRGGRRRGGCRRCGRARRSLATTDRDDTARRLALYWGVVPVCTDIGENVDSAGTLDRPAARRARPGAGRRAGRARQHQPRPDAHRRQLPEDPATLDAGHPLLDHRRRSSLAFAVAALVVRVAHAIVHRALDALDIVSAENRAAVHAAREAADSRADAAGVRRRGARSDLAGAQRGSASTSRAGIRGCSARWLLTHGVNIVVIVVGAFVVDPRGEPGDRAPAVQAGAAARADRSRVAAARQHARRHPHQPGHACRSGSSPS